MFDRGAFPLTSVGITTGTIRVPTGVGQAPARRQARPADDLDDLLDRLADAGEVTRASVPPEGWTWRVRGLGLPPGTAQTLLDDLRADGATR